MAAQYKTKCPHCGAQFKISQEHLKQAQGNVRCGSCLEIFLATENLVAQAPAAKPAPKSPPRKKPAAPPKKTAAKKPAQKKPAPADDEPKWELPKSAAPAKEKKKPPFESNDTGVSLGSSELSDSFLSLDGESDGFANEDFSDMSGAARGGDSDADESWAEQLLEELDDEPEEKPASRAEPPDPDNMSLLDEWSGDDDFETEPESSTPPPVKDSPDEDEMGFLRDEFDMLEEEDELTAIELPEAEEEPRRAAKLPAAGGSLGDYLKWGGLSLVALLVLGGQYLFFNFQELARQPEWRPLYSSICSTLGCQMPNPSDVDQLRGANLVVRSHPSVANALVVDAIIFNEAAYPQPFPVLQLTFSSLKDKPVASRRFTPEDYIAGELRGMEAMPPGVPVHVSFEILDPGSQAMNYTLRFLPAPERG
jgi:predicted Zn finger-like uncharacterized protein